MVVFGWKITLDEMEIGPTDATDPHMDPDLPWRREWDRLLDSAKWCGIDGSRCVDHPCRHCLYAHRVLIDRRSSFFNVFAFPPRPATGRTAGHNHVLDVDEFPSSENRKLEPSDPVTPEARPAVDLLPVTHHDYRAMGVSHAVLTHRSQEHANNLAPTAAADHQQTGVVGGLDQHGCRVALDDGCLNGYPRMGFSDRPQKIAEGDLALVIRVVVCRYRRPSVASGPFPRNENIEAVAGELGLVGCPLDGFDRGN